MQCLEPYETLRSTINKYMSLNNNFINKYYLNNKLNRLMLDNEAQLSVFHLFMSDRVFTGWTNTADSVETSNTFLPFHNILHFNMILMK